MRRDCAAIVLALAITALGPAQSPCPPLGVSVNASGGRLGDAWRVDAICAPTVLGVFGLDLAPGPTATPIGTICLGFGPDLWLLAFLSNAAGTASVGGVMPPTPAFAGIGIYATAVSLDPAQPGGLGLGNGDSFVLRQPRFWFVNPGNTSPFGTTPGAIAATNAISDNVAFSQSLTTSVVDAATVPARGWLALLLGNGTLDAYDGISTAPVMNVALTGTAAQASKVLAVSADDLLLLSYGTPPSPFGGGTPGSIHAVSLPSGVVVASVPLLSGNPDALLQVPGSTLVFVRLANGVVPFDVSSLFLFPAIPLPSGFGALVDWQVAGSLLYCLHGGQGAGPFGGGQPPAISVVDITTLAVLFTNQLAMVAPVQMLRAGPGTAGPALYVYGTAAAALAEFSQGLVQPVSTINVGAGIVAMQLSALGSQWLLLCNGAGCGGPALLQLVAGTTALSTLSALSAPQGTLAVSPSVGYGKACLVLGTNVVFPFGTDPFLGAGVTVLPTAASLWRILSD